MSVEEVIEIKSYVLPLLMLTPISVPLYVDDTCILSP